MTRNKIKARQSAMTAWFLTVGVTGSVLISGQPASARGRVKHESKHTRARVQPSQTQDKVAAASLTALDLAKGSTTISEKEEIETGKRIAAFAAVRYGEVLPDTDPLSIRVSRIGMALAHLSGRHHIPFSYHVLKNDKIANAFSIGGGPIFITRKLVNMTSNDAELAYVLGHETGHIDRKHMVEHIEKLRRATRVTTSLNHVFGAGGDIIGGIGLIAFSFWSLGYSRNQETEADIVGVRLMSRLGYDPRESVKMLDKFDKLYPHSSGGYLSTHPAPQVRETRILELIGDEKLMDMALDHGGPRLWPAGPANQAATLQYLTYKASQQLNTEAQTTASATATQFTAKAAPAK